MDTELELGQTDDARLLVAGRPEAIARTATHLQTLAAAFDQTATGLRGIDVGVWTGPAADAFHTAFHGTPRQWDTAAAAFTRAANAITDYQRTLAWAQTQARAAIELHSRGRATSEHARAAYNQQVDAYNAAAADPAAAPPPPFVDPGIADLDQANVLLARARSGRDASGAEAAGTLADATAMAPPMPSFLARTGAEIGDALDHSTATVGHFLGAVGEGIGDTLRFAGALNPTDPYNVTHPAEYLHTLSTTATGLGHLATHPGALVEAVVGTGWGTDPVAAAGHLLPDLVLGATTGGTGTVGRRVVAGALERGAAEGGEAAAAEVAGGGALAVPAPLVREEPLPLSREPDPRYAGEMDPDDPLRWNNPHVLRVLSPQELEEARVFVQDGKLYSAATGQPFDTSAATNIWQKENRAIYVMDENGNLYASNFQERGTFHHTSFLGGGPVAGAGELEVRDGQIVAMTSDSGHYRPTVAQHEQVMNTMHDQGVDISRIAWSD